MKGDSGAIPARRAASCRSGVCATAGHPRWTGSFSRPRRRNRARPSPAGRSFDPLRVARSSASPGRKMQAPPPIPQRLPVSHRFPPHAALTRTGRTSLRWKALHCRRSAGRKPQEPLQNCHAQAEAVKCMLARGRGGARGGHTSGGVSGPVATFRKEIWGRWGNACGRSPCSVSKQSRIMRPASTFGTGLIPRR
jgi:hypothetical protein